MFPSEGFAAPLNEVPAGIFQRLIENVARIRAAPTYTDELGALLGILPSSGPAPEVDVPPTLKAEAQPGNVVSVKFVRGKTDGIALEMQLDNETSWTVAGNFFKSPAVLNIKPGTGDLPRAVRLRARFLQGNSPTGPNSDTANITTVP